MFFPPFNRVFGVGISVCFYYNAPEMRIFLTPLVMCPLFWGILTLQYMKNIYHLQSISLFIYFSLAYFMGDILFFLYISHILCWAYTVL